MKWNLDRIIFVLGILILLGYLISAYSTYGAPTEFGNETDTTCYVGGDEGILNCTGNITGSYYLGNGSELTDINATFWDEETSQADLNVNSSDYWDNLNTPADIEYADLSPSNISISGYNISLDCIMFDSGGQICSGS